MERTGGTAGRDAARREHGCHCHLSRERLSGREDAVGLEVDLLPTVRAHSPLHGPSREPAVECLLHVEHAVLCTRMRRERLVALVHDDLLALMAGKSWRSSRSGETAT